MVEKLTFNYLATVCGHSCSQQANCMLPQLETSVALCCVTKLYILEWPFIVPSCVMIKLFNQLLDMPHLSGGWIILTKDKMLTNGAQHL